MAPDSLCRALSHHGNIMTVEPAPNKGAEQLYSQYAAELMAYLRRKYDCGSATAQEILQETFEELLRMGECKKVVSIRAYIWGIARNRMLHRIRGNEVAERHALTAPRVAEPMSPEQLAAIDESVAYVYEIVKSMPPKIGDVWVLTYMDGATITEIAQHSGLSKGTVRYRLESANEFFERALYKRGVTLSDLGW